jgi:tetratricopeptide (TPR) repeat protein
MLAGIAAGMTLGLSHFCSDKFGIAIRLALIAALSLVAYRQTGAYFNTETLYTDVLRKNPEASIAWGNVGMDLLDAGRLDDAEECFRRAIDTSQIESQQFDNRSRLLIVFGRSGRQTEFDQMLAYQRSHNIRDSGLLLELAAALSDAGALSEAKIELDRVIGNDPRNVRALAFRAAVLGQLGLHEQAASDARAALAIAPDDIQASHNLAAAEKAILEKAP